MKVTQKIVRTPSDLVGGLAGLGQDDPQLLLVFASVEFFSMPGFADVLRGACPNAQLIGCSTAGEITEQGVEDGVCTLSAIRFNDVPLNAVSTELADMADSFSAGERLGKALPPEGLKAVMLFGPGTRINGSALVAGITGVLGESVVVTGGLAGDGGAFRQTFTIGSSGVSDHAVVAVGLYGEKLRFGHGSFGGWEPFGPARKVTRCDGNILYELDGEPALGVYKRYLGDHAKGLPASGLLFPFAMLGQDQTAVGLIRTILGIDEATGSLTLAGEVRPDGYLKLMHASTDKLVNGAESAADAAAAMLSGIDAGLAVLVSCVGRKLVMGDRVDEEVEAVLDVFRDRVPLCGFYSYGEISPFAPEAACRLHNQTMTISCLGEV